MPNVHYPIKLPNAVCVGTFGIVHNFTFDIVYNAISASPTTDDLIDIAHLALWK